MTDQETTVNKPVSNKVKAATLGAGASVVVTDFALWIVDRYAFTGEGNIPQPVSAFALLAITTAVTWVSGYMAKQQ